VREESTDRSRNCLVPAGACRLQICHLAVRWKKTSVSTVSTCPTHRAASRTSRSLAR